jgi:hypothetical protein
MHDLIGCAPQDHDEDRVDNEPLIESETHTFATGGWHEGFDRPVGLARMGDVLRAKNGGRAIT